MSATPHSKDCTDVIIIGNGPSGICLSFLLSGNRPYYNGGSHSNVYLNRKLEKLDKNKSIVEEDLEYLSEGLDGRSSNPTALLFDNLCRPDADMGVDNPSLLSWKHEPKHSINHIVLGKGKPGGAWQKMDGNMQTLSLANWMELPSLPFKDWIMNHHIKEDEEVYRNRASVADVKNYYTSFVKQNQLNSFYNNHTVTSVRKVFDFKSCIDSESGERLPCCKNFKDNHPFLWEVRGYIENFENDSTTDKERGTKLHEEFCYMAPHVVIATGTFDISNRLNIPGENLSYAVHTLQDFEKCLAERLKYPASDPILIVGSGLSAADAILMALESNVSVIHVFRKGPNDPSIIFKKLPAGIYPEYHRIHALMKNKISDPLYKSYCKHQLIDLKDDQGAFLESTDSKDIISVDISMAVILIGSRPDLSYLPYEAKNLGVVPRYPIECKPNPLDVDQYSFQCNHEVGLFAMGPLVGENFVRFGLGGALGISNFLYKKKQKDCS
ncbi:Oxidative stress-induced growth inhibitor 2,Oxidative stress-induced growth inhibitor 1 [Mytilus edulis]|uniref:Oxidative stress-induced growth inhibitor 2,Oxidative stress-induced growth inhibitor 1 n=1 Tax=Mytilus edulis TaxID=6550 RepID=A0A8S3RA10_MYTED|nr:Oxidative stress-induced growth inhibitor 2,Oxidative stress-induced growth inhibitor 1 [Mytilus edulis]